MAATAINPVVFADDDQITDEQEPAPEVVPQSDETVDSAIDSDPVETPAIISPEETSAEETADETDTTDIAVINGSSVEEVPADTLTAEEETSNEMTDEVSEETVEETDTEEQPAVINEGEEYEILYPAFDQNVTVGNVTVRVSADADTFPEGSHLSVRHVVRNSEIAAVDALIDAENSNTDTTYYFDIKVLDSQGNEIQPANGRNVSISFITPKAADASLEAEVYHVRENGSAEELSVTTTGNSLNVVSDGFSVYAVSFRYVTASETSDEVLVYTLPIDIDAVGILRLKDLFTLASVSLLDDNASVEVTSTKDYVTVGFDDDSHTFGNAYLNVKEEFNDEIVTITVHTGDADYQFHLTASERTNWNLNYITVHFDPNTANLDNPTVLSGSMDDMKFSSSVLDYRCGIDQNLTNFMTCSDGTAVDNPRHLKHSEEKLIKRQKRLSKKKKRADREGRVFHESKRYQEERQKLSEMHRKVSRQRQNFQRIEADKLFKSHDLISAEDLNVKNLLRNHKLAKAISDAGWRSFLNVLKWDCDKRGKQLILVNPANTTQTCHVCGAVSKGEDRILLGTEEWVCPKCLAYHLRDLNAAVNVRDIGFLHFKEQTSAIRIA